MTSPGGSSETVHASCVVLGEAGVLIRGASRAGKSTLARRLVESRAAQGGFARLVADDRTLLAARNGRLIARPVPAIAGMIEIRGLGLCRMPYEPACILRLVVDLQSGETVRFPEEAEAEIRLLRVRLPLVRAALPEAPEMVAWRVRGADDTLVTVL